MSTATETSDDRLLGLLRQRGAMGVADLAAASAVTATAVRQRLARLMSQGLVEREAARQGRGRPSHRYSLTDKARRQVGSNFADLAIVLWEELRRVADPTVRRGLLERVAKSLAQLYGGKLPGTSVDARSAALQSLLADRRVGLEVEVETSEGGLPQLKVVDCPYPGLAERDRGVCAMERMLFAELLDRPVRLSECRLDGHACCRFETN